MNLIAKEKVLRYMDDLEYANQPLENPTADYKELYQWVRRYIAALQPEESRPKGKWEMMRDENTGAIGGKCSNCNKWTLYAVNYDLNSNKHSFDYCPKCGADMRGEE